jgi:hypothetical protein
MGEWTYSSANVDIGIRLRLVVRFTPRSLYLQGKRPQYPFEQEVGCTPEQVWTLALLGIEPQASSP